MPLKCKLLKLTHKIGKDYYHKNIGKVIKVHRKCTLTKFENTLITKYERTMLFMLFFMLVSMEGFFTSFYEFRILLIPDLVELMQREGIQGRKKQQLQNIRSGANSFTQQIMYLCWCSFSSQCCNSYPPRSWCAWESSERWPQCLGPCYSCARSG